MSKNKSPERIDLDELAVQQRNPWLRSLLRKASRYQGHLEAENRRLTADLEEAQATIEDVRHDLSAAQAERDEAQKIRQAVPRVVTADEMREGQVLAVFENGGNWTAGTVTADFFLKLHHAGLMDVEQETETIVLLEDAPAEEPEPVKVGDTISSDARAAELPEGTILLDDDADPWRKGKDGRWRAADRGSSELMHCTAKPVSYTNDPLTVLYLPEEEA